MGSPYQHTLKDLIDESNGLFSMIENLIICTHVIAKALNKIKDDKYCYISSSNILINVSANRKIEVSLKQKKNQATNIDELKYISPEQIQNLVVNHRSTIWSFGVLMYEMITGKLPFEGSNRQEVINSILYGEPKSIIELRSEVPEKLKKAIGRSLSKAPDDRYENISEMIDDIRLACYEVGYKKLFNQLNPDRATAEKKLGEIRKRLVSFFSRLKDEAEDLADETIDEVASLVFMDKVIIAHDKPGAIFMFHARNYVIRKKYYRDKMRELRLEEILPYSSLNYSQKRDSSYNLEILIGCCEDCVKKLLPAADQDRFVKYVVYGFNAEELLNEGGNEDSFRTRMSRHRKKVELCIEDCLESHGMKKIDFIR